MICMVGFLRDNKAQGALEYLLIIGGVIVIAAIIGYYIKTKTIETQDTGNTNLGNVLNKAGGN